MTTSVAGEPSSGPFSDALFHAHIELLETFVAGRKAVVETLQSVLNAQRKPVEYLQDRRLLSRDVEDAFYALPALGSEQARLRGQLEEAHWNGGFRPRRVAGLHNDLIHPAEMAVRGFYCWQQTRWPGRNGRVRYAETLFNVYLLRCLELVSLRVWDAGTTAAGERLARVQSLLDALWASAPRDQPVLVRDARSLIPLALSPTTDELAPYFRVAALVAESFAAPDRLEIQKAGVRMIGGHLRSQIRHYCLEDGVSIDEDSVIRRTRTSNALDLALLIQGLVPLLEAYEEARREGEAKNLLDLASAICQAISPDPELFVNRVDLAGAYSMIEQVFVGAADGQIGYTPLGRRHVELLGEYAVLIGRHAESLLEDCARFKPVGGRYSPYGAIYGTPSNLTEHMALKALQLDAVAHLSVEDVFADGGPDKLEWIDGWRDLPHVDPALKKRHDYPQPFAEAIFERIERALARRVSGAGAAAPTGKLLVAAVGDEDAVATASISDLAAAHVVSSDSKVVAAGRAEPRDRAALLHGREEGYFAVSYETADGWVAIKKDFLTEVLGAGHDAKVVGLPVDAARTLRLMCPGLVATG